jgi:AcrR family transcriptional regulator
MAQIAGARAIARDAVTARIAAAAIDLFDERGFGAVTMDDVARAAGVSVRSVHRYFPAKEDLVVGDPTPTAILVEKAFAASDPVSPLWEALRQALEPLVQQAAADHANGRRIMRIIATTDTLRARNLEKHLAWAQRLTPLVLTRLRTRATKRTSLQARAIVHMALACFDVALTDWANDEESNLGVLLDETFRSTTRF